MGMESVSSIHPLRKGLEGITSPLAVLIKGMGQDRSLERIDVALNAINEPWGIFDLVENEADADEIFEELKALTNIDDPKEAAKKAKEICSKIDNL